jgi:hypothetical protein
MSESSAWELRARNNRNNLMYTKSLYDQLENERKKNKDNNDFVSAPFKIKISVPSHELLDSAKELEYVGLSGLTLYVLQISGKADDLISVELGDVMLIAYCNQDLQKKIMESMRQK